MAGNPVPFPDIRPSGRKFTSGRYPTELFQAQNGATTAIRFGTRPSNCRLQLQFQNISDEMAAEILRHYEEVNGNWDYVNFANDNKTMEAGVKDPLMKTRLRGTHRGTDVRYRYAGPPEVNYTFMDRCTVSCEFIGYLDGGID